jgi:DnaK suppressor protein
VEADRARDLLATERARIQDALAHLGHDDDPAPIDVDPGDLASDLYQEELDEGLAESLEEQLAAVARAEARLDAGTYGLSLVSGHPIPDERLEAVPTAELTVEEERAQSA